MGADIHMFKEKKVNGKWTSLDEWEIEEGEDLPSRTTYFFEEERNYEFFGAIAGVRGNGRIHYSSFPSDVSEEVMIHYVRYWGGDAHSAGFITKKEAINIMKKTVPCPTCGHKESNEKLDKYALLCFENVADNLEDDERCVFWFDN